MKLRSLEKRGMKTTKIIINTNLWTSFLISKKFNQLDKLIKDNKITLIFSKELISEFIEVVNRPKFERYFSKNDIKELLNNFDQFGELKNVKSNIKKCRDEKDNFLLNLAIDSKSDYLITGDNDLLVLEKIDKTKIISFPIFIEHYKKLIN